MNATEARKHQEYEKCMEKVKSYKKGFIFTLYYDSMTKGQRAFFNLFIRDCEKNGLLESIGTGLNLDGEITHETFKKL